MLKYSFLFIIPLFIFTACTSEKEVLPANSSSGYTQDLEKASPKIKTTKEFESCIKPSINMCLTQVANQLARDQKSVAFCDELSDVSSREACKYGVISMQATDMKTIQLCDSLSDTYKKECRIGILQSEALNSSNAEKCNAIQWEYSSLSWSTDNQWSDRVDQCKINIIMKKKPLSEKDCDVLKSIPIKGMCQSLVKSQMQSQELLSNTASKK